MLSTLFYLINSVVLLSVPSPVSSVSISVLPVDAMWVTVLDLTIKVVMIGAAFWIMWGVIVLGGALKDKNGPGLQAGIWQIVGGMLIFFAANAFVRIAVITG